MAFPQVLEVLVYNTFGTPLHAYCDVTMPSSVDAGDLLLVGVSQAQGQEPWDAAPSGWTIVWNEEMFNSGAWAWYKRKADGSEDSAVYRFTTTQGLCQIAALVVHIDAGTWSGDIDDVEAGGYATSFGTSADPDSFGPSWGSDENLWFAMSAWDDDDGGLTGYPADYDDTYLAMNEDIEATGGQQTRLAIALRELEASSVDPGAFTASGSEQWGAGVMAVRGGTGAPPAPDVAPLASHHYRMRRSA